MAPQKWQPRSGFGWEIDHFTGNFVITLLFWLAWTRPLIVGGTLILFAVLFSPSVEVGLAAGSPRGPRRFPRSGRQRGRCRNPSTVVVYNLAHQAIRACVQNRALDGVSQNGFQFEILTKQLPVFGCQFSHGARLLKPGDDDRADSPLPNKRTATGCLWSILSECVSGTWR